MAFSVDSSKTGAAEEPEEKESADKAELSGKAELSPIEETTEPLRDKTTYKYNLLHELMKGLVGISLLVSILITLAMFADLYFSNSFLYFKKSFWGHTYRTENWSQQAVSNGKSKKSDMPIFELFDDQPDPKPTEATLPATDHEKNVLEKNRDDNEVVYSQKKLIDSQKKLIDRNKKSGGAEKKFNKGRPDSSSMPKVLSSPPPEKAEKNKRVPLIAIIIDDVGFDPKIADAISRIDSNFTISILPGSPYGKRIAQSLHSRGIQIMLHLPMEPLQYPSVDPGYGAILSNMAPDQVVKLLNRNLEAIPYIEGVNNHMGSRLTTLSPQMTQILRVLKKRQLFFIDSLTSNRSKGRDSANVIELMFASRDIFLDNVRDRENIRKQLKELIRVARRNGKAIAIGHPYNETYTVLKEEISTLKKNAKVVPVSQLVEVP